MDEGTDATIGIGRASGMWITTRTGTGGAIKIGTTGGMRIGNMARIMITIDRLGAGGALGAGGRARGG